MENIFLTSLTVDDIRQIFQEELAKYFENLPKKKEVAPEQDEELSITELAKYLKRSKVTIHAYKKNGVFPYYQTGRTVYFKKSEVDKALEVGNKKTP